MRRALECCHREALKLRDAKGFSRALALALAQATEEGRASPLVQRGLTNIVRRDKIHTRLARGKVAHAQQDLMARIHA
jgi:hypothetical protein